MAERREDLEAIQVQYPEGYVSHKLIRTISVSQRSGDFFYTGIQVANPAGAKKNRNKGESVPHRVILDKDGEYHCSSNEDRALVPYQHAEQNGMDYADRAGARSVKKTLLKTYETEVSQMILAGAAVSIGDHDNSFIKTVSAVRDSLTDVLGRLVLVLGRKAYRAITERSEIQERMKYTGVATQEGVVVRGIKPEILAQIIDVDEVIVGRDEFWSGDTDVGGTVFDFSNRCALFKVAPQGLQMEDLLLDPIFGCRFQTTEAIEDNPYIIKVWDWDDKKSHVYDAEGYSELKVLNPEGVLRIELTESAPAGPPAP